MRVEGNSDFIKTIIQENAKLKKTEDKEKNIEKEQQEVKEEPRSQSYQTAEGGNIDVSG